MAKKKSRKEPHYQYIRASVTVTDMENAEAELAWEYQLEGTDKVGRMSHDENVYGWTDEEIRSLTRNMLNVDKHDPVEIEVIWD
jgi:hypothetical protein